MIDKRKMVQYCAKQTNTTQAVVQKILNTEWALYKDQLLKGEGIYLPEIGKINTEWREGKKYKSPNTGEIVCPKGRIVMKLIPSPNLKKQLNERKIVE